MRHSQAILVAVLGVYVAVTLGTPTDAVLCIGADGHVAVEPEGCRCGGGGTCGASCFPDGKAGERVGTAHEHHGCACIDIPLRGFHLHPPATSPARSGPSAPVAVPADTGTAEVTLVVAAVPLPPTVRGPPGLDRLRTVVLLI
jgi:hypothetical protein